MRDALGRSVAERNSWQIAMLTILIGAPFVVVIGFKAFVDHAGVSANLEVVIGSATPLLPSLFRGIFWRTSTSFSHMCEACILKRDHHWSGGTAASNRVTISSFWDILQAMAQLTLIPFRICFVQSSFTENEKRPLVMLCSAENVK